MIKEPAPFATKRRVGCVMWLAIAALIVSSISILLDVTQELAWNARVEQAQAPIAAPIVPSTTEAVAQAVDAEEPTVAVAPATTGVTFENVCDVDESNMTDPQINAHAQQFVGQRIEGWPMWVYDVTALSTGQYNLELAAVERGLFWSRDVVIENIDSALATSLNVEQQVTLSGRIDRVDTTFEVVCNPIYVTDATIILADGSQMAAAAPAVAVVVNTPMPTDAPLPPTPLPTWTPVPAPAMPKDARDSLFVHGNNSPQFSEGEQGKVTVVAVGRMDTSEFSASTTLPIVVRNNTGTHVTRIGMSATARDANGGILAAGGGDMMTPNLVQPGEIAFGYIYFSDVNLPGDTRFEFQADFTPAGDSFEEFENIHDLEVTEVSRVENRLVGLIRNQHSETITGPISIEAVCFDAGGQLLSHHSTFTDQDTLSAGATASFQVELEDNQDCTTFLVTGNGFGE